MISPHGGSGEALPAIDFAHGWPEASNAQNNTVAVSAGQSAVYDRALEFFMRTVE